MIEKKITIEGKEMKLRSSALIPKLYRARFGRDIVQDMRSLIDAYKKARDLPKDATEEERNAAQFTIPDLRVFENVSWLMLKHAGEDVGDDPDEWLESLSGLFSVYEILPTVLEMWSANNKTTAVPRKK